MPCWWYSNVWWTRTRYVLQCSSNRTYLIMVGDGVVHVAAVDVVVVVVDRRSRARGVLRRGCRLDLSHSSVIHTGIRTEQIVTPTPLACCACSQQRQQKYYCCMYQHRGEGTRWSRGSPKQRCLIPGVWGDTIIQQQCSSSAAVHYTTVVQLVRTAPVG